MQYTEDPPPLPRPTQMTLQLNLQKNPKVFAWVLLVNLL